MLVLTGGGLLWYFIAGHSWNLAASNFDEQSGQMDGYLAIVYEGTHDASQIEKAAQEDASKSSNTAENTQDASNASNEENSDTNTDLTLDEVVQNYEDKGALVYTLDTENPLAYKDDIIIKKGNYRFGIFSITERISEEELKKHIDYFNTYNVDLIIAVTPAAYYLGSASGVNLIVCTDGGGNAVEGKMKGDSLLVDTPVEGRIGSMVVSSSKTITAKEVKSLE